MTEQTNKAADAVREAEKAAAEKRLAAARELVAVQEQERKKLAREEKLKNMGSLSNNEFRKTVREEYGFDPDV
jgi:hypothetical protein